MGHYDDIIHLPHHVSKRHPQMSMLGRAAQFAPFSALTGYDAVITESGRLTDEWIEQGDYANNILNQKMQELIDKLPEHPVVSIEFFLPDKRKSGGSYQHITGRVRRIDETEQLIEFEDGSQIPIQRIANIFRN